MVNLSMRKSSAQKDLAGHTKKLCGPHVAPRATDWAALEYSLSEAQVLPLGMGISEYLAVSELFRIAKTES